VEVEGEVAGRAPKPHWTLVVLLWVLAGALCALGPDGRALASLANPAIQAKAAADTAPLLPAVTVNPANGTTNVMPSTVVTVSTADPLDVVTLTDSTGATVNGLMDGTGRSWKSAGALKPGRQYQVSVDVHTTSPARHLVSTFSTVPGKLVSASILPGNGQTVGVGMPVVVRFSAPVKNTDEILKGISVWSSSGTEIRAKWFSPYELHFRPAAYWTPGDQVTADLDIDGLDAGNNVFGAGHQRVNFTVGPSHISTVDVNSHVMTVTENGKVLRTMNISAGRPKYPTMNGIHFVWGKAPTVIMDSATVGIPRNSPDGYYEKVNWNVQITTGGEYVHAAPWSVKQQGVNNVSHGCVNASPADAQWFYGLSRMGDIVQVTGSPRPPTAKDGSADWNTAFAQWSPQLATPGHLPSDLPTSVS
jgi:lipoprotein-anchoring transpeptidase ErfK/SrfK